MRPSSKRVPVLAALSSRRLAVLLALGLSLTSVMSPGAAAQCEVSPAYAAHVQEADLGCPTGEAAIMLGAVQAFERGWMYWLEDTQEIYVLVWVPFAHRLGVEAYSWTVYQDTFVEGEPEQAGLTPPFPDLSEPRRGFGKVWREQLGGPQAQIGWAKTPESSVPLVVQDFERGLVLHSPGHFTTILRGDGTWLEPREG